MSLGNFGLLVSMNITKQCTLVEFLATQQLFVGRDLNLQRSEPLGAQQPEAEKRCARFWCDIARLSVLTTRNISFPLFFVEISCWGSASRSDLCALSMRVLCQGVSFGVCCAA